MNFAHTLKKSQKIMLHSAKRIFLLVLCCQITACSSLIQAPAPKSDLSHYYLWLKTLNIDELKAEIERQTQRSETEHPSAELQLVMLHSLPSAPVHNPYTAKAQLNTYQLEPYNTAIFTPRDLAFIVMLKDQLNQQLLLLRELENYKGAYKQAQELITTQEKQLNNQRISTAQLTEQIKQLNKQITQLKKIEQAINKRGQ